MVFHLWQEVSLAVALALIMSVFWVPHCTHRLFCDIGFRIETHCGDQLMGFTQFSLEVNVAAQPLRSGKVHFAVRAAVQVLQNVHPEAAGALC